MTRRSAPTSVGAWHAQIGHVLEALKRTGLAEDTRVIYSTDHGDNLGTRGLWNKDVLYRESTAIATDRHSVLIRLSPISKYNAPVAGSRDIAHAGGTNLAPRTRQEFYNGLFHQPDRPLFWETTG